MFVRIARDKGGRLRLTLEEPDDCTRFHLRAEGIGPALAAHPGTAASLTLRLRAAR